MGLKMEISRQKEMGPSKLAPNDRGTWVQMSYTYLQALSSSSRKTELARKDKIHTTARLPAPKSSFPISNITKDFRNGKHTEQHHHHHHHHNNNNHQHNKNTKLTHLLTTLYRILILADYTLASQFSCDVFNTTFRTAKMITRESQSVFNFGRGAYDTTGVPKPPQPPKPSRR
nr:hypothetical protein B12F1.170 [imported] - Neurospora crassa [Neurospora crassa]